MASDDVKLGIVLMNLGGPTGEDHVRPFLYNLFRDEDIIKLGGGRVQDLFARLIAKFRAPSVRKDYEEINGCPKGCTGNKHCLNRQNRVTSTCCSPINGLTEQQRRGLEKHFKHEHPGLDVSVYTCMRYWIPFADQIMDDMVDDGITHAVMVPLYPQFSWTTTGSSFRDWENHRREKFGSLENTPWKEYQVKNYHRNPLYLEALNDRVNEVMEELDPETRQKTHLIFSAHGTPKKEVQSGDPYTTEIEQTMEAVMDLRGRREDYWIGYQSKVGPGEWTQPNTAELVERHLQYGIRNFVLVPVAFVTDHIETLYELGVELPEDLEEEGYHFENIKVMPGINDHPLFIEALADEALKKVGYLFEGNNGNSETAVAGFETESDAESEAVKA